MSRRIFLTLSVCAYFLAHICGSASASVGNNEAVDVLAEDFFQWRITESPEYGTQYGFHDHDDKLEEITEAAFLRRKNAAGDFLVEAGTISPDELDEDHQITLEILKYDLEVYIVGYDFRLIGQYAPLSPLEPMITHWLYIFGLMKYETEDDYRKYLSRLTYIQIQIAQHILLMKEGIAEGKTAHNVSLTGVADRFESEVAKNLTSSLYTPLNNFPESFDEDIRSELYSNGSDIIQTVVFPAFEHFRLFLLEEYAPNTRVNEGVGAIPDGQAFYQQALTWHLSTDMTPQEVHDKGLSEVSRIQALMEKEMQANSFQGTIQEYVAHLMTQEENFYGTEDEMVEGYEQIVNRTHEQLHRLFNNVPTVPVIVVKNPDPNGLIGSYGPPTTQGGPGTYYVNVNNPETRPKFNMAALTLHEAEPGHHLWFVSVMLHDDVPSFRKYTDYKYYPIPFHYPVFTSITEGWALYAEALGEEIESYELPHSLFGRYGFEMWRAVRLVVDTGIHAFGWSKQQAVDYVAKYTTLSLHDIENEVNRYISWPGQACAYKIGELKLRELRQRAEDSMGEQFDLKAFHDQILNLGLVPLSMIEETIDRWIEQNTSSAATRIGMNISICWIVVWGYLGRQC